MIQENLHQATFKGAAFYWRRISTELGKKSVSHNYPGTAKRFVEDMGQLPKIFTIEASVAGGVGGNQYFQNKQALEQALSSPGPGYLVHPTYGRVLVTAKPATCTEENTRLGEARYSLTFEKSDEQARPIGTTANLREVEIKRAQAIDQVVQVSADEWQVPESPSVFDMVAQKVRDLSDQMNKAAADISAQRAEVYQVFGSIQALKNSAAQLITEPLGLFNDMKDIYWQVMSMDDFASDQFERIVGFFGGSPDSGPREQASATQKIKAVSYETEAAESNRILMNESSNMMAMINAYSAISKVDFQSTDQLDSFVERVESQFSNMNGSGLMNTALRDTVLSLRIAAHKLVEQKRLLTKEVIASDFKNDIPLSVALYMFEGDIADGDYILGLNAEQDPTFAQGEIRLLQ